MSVTLYQVKDLENLRICKIYSFCLIEFNFWLITKRLFGILGMEVRMYNYIKGNVAEVASNYIVIDNNGIGYAVFVANPFIYQVGDEYKVFIYSHIREDEYSLYGFKSSEEKTLFLKLINVKGVGPKVALPFLATGNINGVIDAIDRENILYLTKFPKIGDKVARQIILDLKGKLVNNLFTVANTNEELTNVLESLGYKSADIKKILPKINQSNPVESQVKEALKLLMSR